MESSQAARSASAVVAAKKIVAVLAIRHPPWQNPSTAGASARVFSINTSVPPPPWSIEKIPGGLKGLRCRRAVTRVCLFTRKLDDAHMAKVLTEDEARGIANAIAKLPALLAEGVCFG